METEPFNEFISHVSSELTSLIVRARDVGETAVRKIVNPSDLVELDKQVYGCSYLEPAQSETDVPPSLVD